MSDPASITLSPCPFCGGEGRTSKFTAVVVRQPWRALCMNDDCPMELHCDFSTEAEAIAAWETRAALAQPASAQAGVADPLDGLPIERENMLAERQHLLDRKFAGNMTQTEAQRLAFIRYGLDIWEEALAALGGEDG